MTLPDPERAAFYAALEANPDDFGLRGIFADWLDERGEHELAEGYRAIGVLRVAVDPDRQKRRICPVNSWSEADRSTRAGAVRESRGAGEFQYVTAPWFDATYELMGGHGGHERRRSAPQHLSYREYEDAIARAYARLTPEDKAEVERFLAPVDGK